MLLSLLNDQHTFCTASFSPVEMEHNNIVVMFEELMDLVSIKPLRWLDNSRLLHGAIKSVANPTVLLYPRLLLCRPYTIVQISGKH